MTDKFPVLLAVDWGSSRFRAYLLAENGVLIDTISSDAGIYSKNKDRSYEQLLYSICGDWLNQFAQLSVLMSGMIGSRHGWVETRYINCPVSLKTLSNQIIQIPNVHPHPIYIVPGISNLAVSSLPDVIRGEETQVFGLLLQQEGSEQLACFPGTHSKWVKIDQHSIIDFSTFMTGEFFAVIQQCESLAAILDTTERDQGAFLDGVSVSRNKGSLLHHLFSVRSRTLIEQDKFTPNVSYLSGLLIGAEINAGLTLYPDHDEIIIVGDKYLIDDYGLALSTYGVGSHTISDNQASVAGLWQLAATADILFSSRKHAHA